MSGRFEAFLERLESRGDRECLVCDGRTHRYTDLLREFDSARDRIATLGIERRNVVALRADYSLQSVAALLALLAARTTVAMLPRDRAADALLADCHATALLDIDPQGHWNWTTLAASTERHPLLVAIQVAGDAGIVLFTSGSTGRPKAALQSMHRFLGKFDRPGKSFRTLAFLLFDHVAGLDTLFYTLSNGGTVVVTRDRSPSAISRLIDDARVEVLSASPTFLRLLCLAGDDGERDLSSLKIITYGSEPMDPAHARAAQRALSQLPNQPEIRHDGNRFAAQRIPRQQQPLAETGRGRGGSEGRRRRASPAQRKHHSRLPERAVAGGRRGLVLAPATWSTSTGSGSDFAADAAT